MNSEHQSNKPGVKTNEGKDIVRHNAFKHGLTSKTLLSGLKSIQESESEYLEIVEGLRSSFVPKNYFEEAEIEKMAKAMFRSKRFEVLITSLFAEDDDFINSKSFFRISDAPQFELALKYKGSIDSQYYKALDSIIKTRTTKQLDLFLPEGF